MTKKEQKSSGNEVYTCNQCKVECNKKQIIHYANSVMDFTHGFSEYICRDCYIQRMEKQLKILKEGIEREKKLLKKYGKGKRHEAN